MLAQSEETKSSAVYFYEKIDRCRARWILDHFEMLDNINKLDTNQNFRLGKPETRKYLNDCLTTNPMKIEYKRGKDRSCARLISSTGLQRMKRIFRHTLCVEDYYDVDMVNCQPTLLQIICYQKNIRTFILTGYVRFREKIISEIKKNYPEVTKGDIKNGIIVIMNCGPIPKKVEHITFFQMFFKEIGELVSLLKNKFPIEYDNVKRRKADDNYNLDGKFINHLIVDFEAKVLDKIVKRVQEYHNVEVSTLVYDGFMIHKKDCKVDIQTILDDVNEYINKEISYSNNLIRLITKEIDEGFDIPKDELEKIRLELENPIIYSPIKPKKKLEITLDEKKSNNEIELDNEIFEFNPNHIIVKNKRTVGEVYLDLIGDNILRYDERYYIREFGNIYAEDISGKEVGRYVYTFIMSCTNVVTPIKTEKEGNQKYRVFCDNPSIGKTYKEDVLNRLGRKKNSVFIENMHENTLSKLCFLNGYYDFDKLDFFPYPEKPNWVSSTYIKRNFNPEKNQKAIDAIYERMLDKYFIDKDLQKYFLQWHARGLAGRVRDKSWMVSISGRDSGKTQWTDFLKKCLGKYCVTFNPEQLFVNDLSSDQAKALMWLKGLETSRLAFSNEMSTSLVNGKTKMNSSLVKAISGGDEKTIRLLFKQETAIRIQARMCMFCNEMVPLDNPDATKSMVSVAFQSEFKNEEFFSELDIKKNNDPFSQIRIHKIDINNPIDDFIRDEDIQNAMIHILIDHYDNKVPVPPVMAFEIKETIVDNNLNELNDILNETFVFSGKETDQIRYDDVMDIMKIHLKTYNKFLIADSLLKLGSWKKRESNYSQDGKRKIAFFGIRLKSVIEKHIY
ncbi:MAG: hypothetical protein ACRCXZ_10280 [Patescibacteria group bacterium]